MKLNSELTARTILRWQSRTHHHRFINGVLAQLSTSRSLDSPTTIAGVDVVGRIPELLMTEQTHSAYARPAQNSWPPTKR
ncbi:hypothetical protein [Mycolicibacter minnesotensis]|uniref:hypothetical protein n=1 Tax=Mycolicibacter minnesotensis TaxID=1118379 RepID=UPI001F1BC9AD|nr:hypothetical protein [Mycolicibacter minnesotensis]